MTTGKRRAPLQGPPTAPAELAPVPEPLAAFAKWLLDNPQAMEVWGLDRARLARIECVADEPQTLELDSGDRLLVRISGLPTSLTPGGGIVRFVRRVEASGQG